MSFRAVLNKRRLTVILMLAAAAASLAGPAPMAPLRRLARLATAPGGDAGMYVATGLARRFEAAGRKCIPQDRAWALARENGILRLRLGQMARRLAGADRRIAEIQAIRTRLYGRSREVPSELIPARVVATDSLPYGATRLVNPGRAAAEAGMLVTTRMLWLDHSKALPAELMAMTPTALVGRLTETDAFTARLQLVTDVDFRIPVLVRRVVRAGRPRLITSTGPDGPSETLLTAANADIEPQSAARGNGAGAIEIPHVKRLHAVEAGDTVFTRDSDPAVGAEIPLGVVSKVIADSRQPGLFVTLRVRPRANLAALRQVYIIVPPYGGFPSPRRKGPQR